MKKLYFLFICFFTVGAFAQTYNGNGRSGFGGAVGQGSLKITFKNDTAYFELTKGPGGLNDAVVIYIMTNIDKPDEGFTTTANFTDESDGLRRAVSGVQGANRATLNFPSGFRASMAAAFNSDFAGIFELKENGTHTYFGSGDLHPVGDKNSPTYTFKIPTGGDNAAPEGFGFLVTYISETGHRSNEFIGDNGPESNPGSSPYTATTYNLGMTPPSRTYYGNGKNGLGGIVGNSKLKLEEHGDSAYFIFRPGPGNFQDIMVLYAQGDTYTHTTGINTTANFTDYSNKFRVAASGFNGANRSTLNFSPRFFPDIAIVMDKDSARMYELVENGVHISLIEGTYQYRKVIIDGQESYVFSLPSFGGGFGPDFGFLATYITEGGYRSNEFIGDPGPQNSPGFSAYTAVTFAGDKGTVPVTLTDFTGSYQKNIVRLQWLTSQESNIDKYEILRSTDGAQFGKIGSVSANNFDLAQTYSFEDLSPNAGNNFYKLAIVGMDGSIEYSKIVNIKISEAITFNAYMTAGNRILKLDWKTQGAAPITLEINNMAGQKIYQSTLNPNGSGTHTIDLKQTLKPGVYAISVYQAGEKVSKMVMVK